MRSLIAVLAGGLAGTAARLGVDALLPLDWATLVVNTIGSFALGLLVARLWRTAPEWLRAGLGAGLLGSFTTFSAIALAVVTPEPGTGIWFLVAGLVLGIPAAYLGLLLGRPATPRFDEVNE